MLCASLCGLIPIVGFDQTFLLLCPSPSWFLAHTRVPFWAFCFLGGETIFFMEGKIFRENGREETEDVGAGVDCRVLGVRAAEVPVRAFPDSRVSTRRACVRA
jgi:hypothetical protein